MHQHKQRIRDRIRELMRGFSSDQLASLSAGLIEEVERLEQFRRARTVMAYWSLPDEVCTHAFVSRWHGEKRIALPALVHGQIVPHLFTGRDAMAPRPPFGICEPQGAIGIPPSALDLVLVPGVAFDGLGNRLGRGRGHYDRLLACTSAYRVGICFPFQLVSAVPSEAHDARMDLVVCGLTGEGGRSWPAP